MKFTYKTYENLIGQLKEKKYCFSNYENYTENHRAVILRHDIDNSLEDAVTLAELEAKLQVPSTYFVLLSTNFYNVLSKSGTETIQQIKALGHEIGLHFDETKYPIQTEDEFKKYVVQEAELLQKGLGIPIKTVSMHRPSKWVLEKNIVFEKVINSYAQEFFREFKYISDSRMHWREDVEKIITSEQYHRLHILTHPFWYHTKETSARKILMDFLKRQKEWTYQNLKENIRDLDEWITEKDLLDC